MSASVAKPELVKLPVGANRPSGQRGELWPWGALSAPGTKPPGTRVPMRAGDVPLLPAHTAAPGKEDFSAARKRQGRPFVLLSLPGQRGPGADGRQRFAAGNSRPSVRKHQPGRRRAGCRGAKPPRRYCSRGSRPRHQRGAEACAGREERRGPDCISRQAAPRLPASRSARHLGEEGTPRRHPPVGGVPALRMGTGGGEEG